MRSAAAVFAVLLLAACAGGTKNNQTAQTAVSSPNAGAASPAVAASGGDWYYGARLPAGPERAALQADCEICHSGDMYATQRLSKATWTAEVTKMMKFGSPLPAGQKDRLVAYLAKYLGPTVPRPQARRTATAPAITYTSAPQAQ